jgi:hypothetical protein
MTGAESLSLGTSPVTEIPSALSLYRERCGVSPQKGSAETVARPQGKTFPISGLVQRGSLESCQKVAYVSNRRMR